MKILDSAEKYLLYFLVALFPIFNLASFSNPYVIPKEILLVAGLSLMIVLWVIKMIIRGSFSFSIGKFDLGILLIAISYLLSTFFATPNKMEAYLIPGTTTFVLAGAVLYFLINQFNEKAKKGVSIALFMGALILSLSTILTTIGVFSKIPQLPAFIKDVAFNPMGGNVPAAIILATLLVFSIGLLINEKDLTKKLFYGVSMAIVTMGIVILVGSALPGKSQSPKFVSMQTSWEIAVETLKKSPLIGVGPANYLTAFNLYRPVTYNQTDLWQVRFTTASNYYFTLLTETGFLGFLALVVLLFAVYKAFLGNLSNPSHLSVLLLLVLFALFPISPAVIVFLFVLLAILSKSENRTMDSVIGSRIPSIIVGVPFLAGVITVLFFGSRVLAAEATFKMSLDALSKNDAKGTYDLMNKAISQNNKVDRYHASFAQVDMALATSLANKKDIKDTDRNTITQLVQQAIAEGKSTVALNPGRSGNWEVLAQIYRSIMPFAQGADQFAIQSYTQSVALDPTNPNLRIALGGVYYALGRYDEAIDSFKLAALAKNNLANAHYNLSLAYREKKDFDSAIAEMNNVLSLVDKNSQDYTVAKAALEDLQKNKPVAKTGTDNLTSPQPVGTSNIKPPITLPEEATPPASNP